LTEYLKRVHKPQSKQEEYYHWNTECPDIPKRGKDTMLIFHEKPLNTLPCQKCTQIDMDKKAKRQKAKKPPR